MTGPERERRVFELFQEAVELAPSERRSWLRSACGDDDALRRDLESLLAADDRFEAEADRPSPLNDGRASPIGRQIGPYRILEEIGQGGMGVVYLAAREDVDTRVALKLVRSGRLASRDQVDRFLLERRMLARLDHPNIARLLDAGVTDEGVPYFAMEHVDGTSVTEHCARRNASVDQRLDLFVQICGAVQYAHGQLVVHRDLKPSNILVRDDGTVKLLDFGIAKLLGEDPAGMSRTGTRLMTPEYAAPEQVAAEPVSAATDVYALGVVLYELLSGQRPYRFDSRNPLAIARVISEVQPPRPSTAVGDSATLRRRLVGDLDTIVLQALRKEPARRYASVALLEDDIDRHRRDLPVRARGDSAAYRARKFFRRHRVAVAVAALLGVVLVAAALRERTLRTDAELARDRARLEAGKSGEVARFLRDLFRVAGPEESRGNTITARELLDRGADRIDRELSGQPELHASLLGTVGQTYVDLGLYDEAEKLLERALETARSELGDRHAETLRAWNGLAVLRERQGRLEEAGRLFRESLERHRSVLGPEHPDTIESLANLGLTLRELGAYDQAEPLLVEALELGRRVNGPAARGTLNTMAHLGTLYMKQSRHDLAVDLARQVVAAHELSLEPDHPATIHAHIALGAALTDADRLAEAEPVLLQALARSRRVFGDVHPTTLSVMTNLGQVYSGQHRLQEAEALELATLEAKRRQLGDEHPRTLNAMNSLAITLWQRGRHETAATLFEQALTISRRVRGAEHPETLKVANNLGGVYANQGRLDEAAKIHEDNLAVRRRILGERHPTTLTSLLALGAVETQRGRLAEAGRLLDACHRDLLATLGEEHLYVAYSHYYQGCLAAARGRRAEALRHLTRAVDLGWAARDILSDATLDSLRGDVAFDALVTRVQEALGE